MWMFAAGAGLVLSALTAGRVAGRLFRVAALPPPTGPFPVATATTSAKVVLSGRDAVVPVTLWYPASGAAAPYPLLLAFPGWLGRVIDIMPLAIEMASRGYAVAAIDDLGQIEPHETADATDMDFSSAAGYAATLRLADAKVARTATLAGALLDALLAGRVEATPPLDPHRIGAFGFSFGGAVAAEAGARDGRIRSVANLDGWLFGQAAADGIGKPYLVISDANPVPSAADIAALPPPARYTGELDLADIARQRAHLAEGGGCFVTVAGTAHENFSAGAYRRSLHRPDLGPIDPARATQIVRACAVAFFRATMGNEQPLAQAMAALSFPEAQVQCWPGPNPASAPAIPAGAPR